MNDRSVSRPYTHWASCDQIPEIFIQIHKFGFTDCRRTQIKHFHFLEHEVPLFCLSLSLSPVHTITAVHSSFFQSPMSPSPLMSPSPSLHHQSPPSSRPRSSHLLRLALAPVTSFVSPSLHHQSPPSPRPRSTISHLLRLAHRSANENLDSPSSSSSEHATSAFQSNFPKKMLVLLLSSHHNDDDPTRPLKFSSSTTTTKRAASSSGLLGLLVGGTARPDRRRHANTTARPDRRPLSWMRSVLYISFSRKILRSPHSTGR